MFETPPQCHDDVIVIGTVIGSHRHRLHTAIGSDEAVDADHASHFLQLGQPDTVAGQTLDFIDPG